MNVRQNLRREDGLIRKAGLFESRHNVLSSVVGAERFQIASQDNALLQLSKIGSFQFTVQLRLSGQNHLDQLAAPVFQVAQQAYLFQNFPLQIVRFVHDQDSGSTLVGLIEQQGVQRKENFRLRFSVATQIQIVSDHFKELVGGDAGIEDEGEFYVLRVQEVTEALQHGGFPGSHLAGQYNEALPALNPIDEVCQRLFVLLAPVKESRIRT